MFYDEFEKRDEYKDIVYEETTNGRFKLLENREDVPTARKTEIGQSCPNPEEIPVQEHVQNSILEDEPEDKDKENRGMDHLAKRATGRPRKILTGRPGRHKKQYQVATNGRNEDIEIDEEAQNFENIQINDNLPV